MSIEPIPHAVDEPDCEHVVGHLNEYLDSEMTEEDTERMRAHLAHCSPCLAELSVDEILKQVLRRSCADKAPEGLRARLHAQFTATTVAADGSSGATVVTVSTTTVVVDEPPG